MKTALKNAVKTARTALEIRPEIDYPQQDETVNSRHYSFRVTAPDAADEVSVAINQGDWKPCRRASGYWWYDWTGFEPGEYEIVSRARARDGRWLISTPHEFLVR
ncbi:MAG: hypothetical protein KGM24_00925 [Elusimicrobia bacterium]|nr:hypothetical protein [Elusimicrobiota bacterium]